MPRRYLQPLLKTGDLLQPIKYVMDRYENEKEIWLKLDNPVDFLVRPEKDVVYRSLSSDKRVKDFVYRPISKSKPIKSHDYDYKTAIAESDGLGGSYNTEHRHSLLERDKECDIDETWRYTRSVIHKHYVLEGEFDLIHFAEEDCLYAHVDCIINRHNGKVRRDIDDGLGGIDTDYFDAIDERVKPNYDTFYSRSKRDWTLTYLHYLCGGKPAGSPYSINILRVYGRNRKGKEIKHRERNSNFINISKLFPNSLIKTGNILELDKLITSAKPSVKLYRQKLEKTNKSNCKHHPRVDYIEYWNKM